MIVFNPMIPIQMKCTSVWVCVCVVLVCKTLSNAIYEKNAIHREKFPYNHVIMCFFFFAYLRRVWDLYFIDVGFLTVDWIDDWNYCKCDYTTETFKRRVQFMYNKQWPKYWRWTELNIFGYPKGNRTEKTSWALQYFVWNMRLFSLFYSIYLRSNENGNENNLTSCR